MAATLGISAASVSRHWRAKGLLPFSYRVDNLTVDRLQEGRAVEPFGILGNWNGGLKFKVQQN